MKVTLDDALCRSLNSNRLTSVPASLGRLQQLSRLSLHINALTGVRLCPPWGP
jgi:hypothetical protein